MATQKYKLTKSRYENYQGYSSDVVEPGKNTYTGQERESNSGAGRGQVNPPNANGTESNGRPLMSKKWSE